MIYIHAHAASTGDAGEAGSAGGERQEASNCRMRGYARKGWGNDSAPRISGFGIEAPNPKVSMEGNARCRLVGW